MSTATALHTDSFVFSKELYALLRQIDPSRFRDDVDREASDRLAHIANTLRTLVARWSESSTSEPIADRLKALQASIERASAAAAQSAKARWAAFLQEVHPAYEALASALRSASLPAPSLRPTNHPRSLFHVASAMVALAAVRFLPSRTWLLVIALGLVLFAWPAETLRRLDPKLNTKLMGFFGPIAHAHEYHRINSATWYCTALLILSVFFPLPAAAAAVTVLGWGDPAAALIGRRFGRTKLRAGRSLEGSLTFAIVGAATTWVMFRALYPSQPHLLLASIAAGIAGALAELLSTRVDDNLSVPLAAAVAVAGVGLLA